MGQKTNPNIFRLGVNKTWKTEFFEKKRHELPVYIFKDLEIKDYIERFLESQGLLLHDYKQHFSNSTLNLYISYLVLPDFILSSNRNKSTKVTLITSSGKRKTVQTSSEKVLSPKVGQVNHSFFQGQASADLYNIKRYLNSQVNRLELIKRNRNQNQSIENRVLNLKIESVLNNLFKVISLFTGNKFNIIVNFNCINKTTSFLKSTQKKNFILLQKFKGTPFLKEGIELLFHVVHTKTSAHLLAKFIAFQIKKIKRHKFFLSFLKQTLTVLSNSRFSTVKGIKIIIKGRLNGVPRAKHRIITIGDVPVQSINAIIDYSQTAVHNANGSYGIKVWIIEKS